MRVNKTKITVDKTLHEATTTIPKLGGTLTTQIDSQTFVMDAYFKFNQNSTETFQDKLLRATSADLKIEANQS